MFNFAKLSTPPSSISPHSRRPTPAGVPVNIKSHGHSSKKLERPEITSATDQIISGISPCWRISPFTDRVILPRSMWPTSSTLCKSEQGADRSKPLVVAQACLSSLLTSAGHNVSNPVLLNKQRHNPVPLMLECLYHFSQQPRSVLLHGAN